jgi:phage recombination protein Bet
LTVNAVVKIDGKLSLLATMAARFGVEQENMLKTLKATAFKGDVTTEQMMALCIVANQYGLNPWTKEIYAFPDRNGIVPVVGVDGWSRIINEHKECDGIQFNDAEDGSWIECTIYRKDRTHPTTVREYMAEVKRETAPWKSHPRRMLRHKALIQCARVAFGFGGIYDQDEAERIIDVTPPLQANPRDGIETADPVTVDGLVAEVADILAQDVEETQHADLIFGVHQRVCSDDSVYTALMDAVKARGIIKPAAWKAFVAMGSKQFQERNSGVIR